MHLPIALCCWLSLAAAPAADVGDLEQQAFRDAVARVAPSVVQIETLGSQSLANQRVLGNGASTGLVVGADGYIVTSAFNLAGKPTSILVRLPDGTRKSAEVVATDHHRMLVLLKIKPDAPLPLPEMLPQREMRIGQWTIAVGRAFDYKSPNMAVGVLAATNRIWGKAIQTDAAVSPNNYGGPLVDLHGRVLGVLVALSPNAESEVAGVEWYDSGIGFAVPYEHLLSILSRLKKGEDLHPGLLGFSFGNNPMMLQKPVFTTVRKPSPAAKAGLKTGDCVLEVEGQKVERAGQVKEAICRRYAGDTLHLVVDRQGKRIEAAVEMVASLPKYEFSWLGIYPRRPLATDDKNRPHGVELRDVAPAGPAARAGLRAGDRIVSVGGKAVADRAALAERLTDYSPATEVVVEYQRQAQKLKATVTVALLSTEPPANDLPAAHDAAPAGVAKKSVKTGRFKQKADEFPNGVWTFVPENFNPAIPYSLVVWLHRKGGLDPDKSLAAWEPLCRKHDFILVAPLAADPDRWYSMEAMLLEKFLVRTRKQYGIDPARVVLHGQETGASLACLLAFRTAGSAAGLALVDGRSPVAPPETAPETRLQVYLASATGATRAAAIETLVERLEEQKYPVVQRPLGAQPRYLNDQELTELARWIDSLDRI